MLYSHLDENEPSKSRAMTTRIYVRCGTHMGGGTCVFSESLERDMVGRIWKLKQRR